MACQPGLSDDCGAHAADHDDGRHRRDRDRAAGPRAAGLKARGATRRHRVHGRYFSTGTPAPDCIHRLVIDASSPSERSFAIAVIDALGELRMLGQQHAPVVASGRAELADDDAVRDLARRQIEGGRQVDDDRVDAVLA